MPPRAIRARYGAFRYFPDPHGIVTEEVLDKLEFGGESPQTSRARCCAFRYCPDPLGIVTEEVLDKLEFVYPKSHSNLFQCSLSFDSSSLIFGTIEPANETVFSCEKYIAQVKSLSV